MRSFCKHFLLSLIFVGFLQGCGGGGGGSGSPPANVAAGVYNNSSNGIWTFLLAESVLASNATTPNWFGIRLINATSFELFSSRVTGVGGASATGTVKIGRAHV